MGRRGGMEQKPRRREEPGEGCKEGWAGLVGCR